MDLDQLRQRATVEACRRDLMTYIRVMDPAYKPGRFHYYLAGLLEKVESGEIKRLAISVPPRHGKSRMASHEFVSWALGRDPKRNVIIAGHGVKLSLEHSKNIRRRLRRKSHLSVFPDSELDPRDQSAQNWRMNAGGALLAAATSGEITGRGADLLIIDDPHSGMAEAKSPAMREATWLWYTSDAYTRLSPNGSIILIMTRWHPDDLAGRILDPKRRQEALDKGGIPDEWTVVNLPGIAKDKDAFGRQAGEALWPEWWPTDRLLQVKAVMPPGSWAAEYDGNPVPDGGNKIGRNDFQYADQGQVPAGLVFRRFWDLATSSKATADLTAGAKGALDGDGNLWIVDITADRWDWPQSRTVIKSLAEAERIPIGVEAQGGFSTSHQNLIEVTAKDISIAPYTWAKDKLERAWPWIALAKNKKVFLVRGPWMEDFLTEAEQFPDGAHDDRVDAVSGLYVMLTGRQIFVA